MTGLAALAIAACRFDWLAAMFVDGEVGFIEGHAAARARLPIVEDDGGSAIRLQLPEVAIHATPLALAIGSRR